MMNQLFLVLYKWLYLLKAEITKPGLFILPASAMPPKEHFTAALAILALLQALDFSAGDTVGSSGVIDNIATQPHGRLMLAILAISLMGYVMWRFIQAVLDPEHDSQDGQDAKGIVRRIGYACSGLAYTGVAFSAAKVLLPLSSGNRKPVHS
jgi:hypothetical protein